MKDISLLYKELAERRLAPEALTEHERRAIFTYLCNELENGNTVDENVLKLCAPLSINVDSSAEQVIESTYRRLTSLCASKKRVRRLAIIKRTLVASIAVCSFIVFTLITASAFGLGLTDHIKTLFYEEESVSAKKQCVYFESTGKPMKKYDSVDTLFATELKGLYYPSYIPNGVTPYLVTKSQSGDALFTYKLKSEDGKDWIVSARPAENAYLPMGYKYNTVLSDGTALTFVYSLSRNNGGVTQYTVYSIIENVLYTQTIPIGDWETAKAFIDSFKKA